MYFVFLLIIFFACVVALSFFGGAAIAGGMYLNQRLFGEPDNGFDFERRDDSSVKEFAIKCILAAAGAAALTLLIGFVIGGATVTFRPPSRRWMLGMILLVLHFGAAFGAILLVFKQEPKRVAVAAAAMTLMFLVLDWMFFLDYMV